MRPNGELARLDRNDADFAGSVVALGCVGVVTRVTLDVEPSYEVRQYVYEGLPLDHFPDHLLEVLGSAYSVSVFTDWSDASPNNQVWVKQKVFDDLTVVPTVWHGGTLADGARHPVPGMSPDNCTEQLGVPGRWNERLPHFRAGFQPSSGDEIQAEFFVAAEHAAEAFEAVRAVRAEVTPVLQISEIRAIATDGLWLSPASGRDTVGIHFTFTLDAAGVAKAVTAVEAALAPFAPRPHWGKVFSLDPAVVAATYPRFADFGELVARVDPEGKLTNDFVDRVLSLSR
jgi:xylitol oxidase